MNCKSRSANKALYFLGDNTTQAFNAKQKQAAKKRYFIFLCSAFSILFSSCSVQKRHYTKGFYFVTSSAINHSAYGKTALPKNTSARISHANPGNSSLVNAADETEQITLVKKQKIFLHSQQKKSSLLKTNKPTINFTARHFFLKSAFLAVVLPNHVAKAGLRMAIISLLFFAAAYFVFTRYPELVYITTGLLIISFIFALVSIISSASARKDKINNTKGWLGAAAFAIVLSVLLICAIGLFFILLF